MKSEGYIKFMEKQREKEMDMLQRWFATLVFLEGLVIVISWRLLV